VRDGTAGNASEDSRLATTTTVSIVLSIDILIQVEPCFISKRIKVFGQGNCLVLPAKTCHKNALFFHKHHLQLLELSNFIWL
jgi:hypothetical protein